VTTAPDAPAGRVVVVAGFGSEYRHDDGVGVEVAARLSGLTGVRDVGPVADPLDLLGRWDDADLAVVVDALRSGDVPGTLRSIELPAGGGATPREHAADGVPPSSADVRLPGGPPATSTHGIGLAGVIRLARAVGRAPGRVVVVGIEGDDFSQGIGLSPAVAAAVPRAVALVTRIIEEERRCA
jgi:hydrogenase maturation protease